MGRPIKDKYFANLNEGGVGGSGVTAVALGTAGTNYSTSTTTSVTAPQIAGGVTAVITPVITFATGAVASYTVTDPGSGYTSAPTVTLVKPTTVAYAATGSSSAFTISVSSVFGIYVGMFATGTNVGASAKVSAIDTLNRVVTVTVANAGAIASTVTFTDNGASGVPGTATLAAAPLNGKGLALSACTTTSTPRANSDIVKQRSARSYMVKNSDGYGRCKLVAATPSAIGEASLTATDSSGKTYYVIKLMGKKALLKRYGTSGWEFADATLVRWTMGAAVLNTSVTLAQI